MLLPLSWNDFLRPVGSRVVSVCVRTAIVLSYYKQTDEGKPVGWKDTSKFWAHTSLRTDSRSLTHSFYFSLAECPIKHIHRVTRAYNRDTPPHIHPQSRSESAHERVYALAVLNNAQHQMQCSYTNTHKCARVKIIFSRAEIELFRCMHDFACFSPIVSVCVCVVACWKGSLQPDSGFPERHFSWTDIAASDSIIAKRLTACAHHCRWTHSCQTALYLICTRARASALSFIFAMYCAMATQWQSGKFCTYTRSMNWERIVSAFWMRNMEIYTPNTHIQQQQQQLLYGNRW